MKTAIAILLLSLSAFAHAQCTCGNGVFVDVRAGQSNLNAGIYNDNSVGYSGDIGYRFQLTDAFEVGPEVGYTWLGRFNSRNNLFTNLHRAHVSGGNIGVNALYHLSSKFYLTARTGVFHSGPTATYTLPNGSYAQVDATSTKYYTGIGAGVDLLTNISIGVDYTYYRVGNGTAVLNPSLIAAVAEVRF